MDEIKVLVFDIDGTLVPFKAKKPSKRTIKILNELKKDYKIVCATGRHILEIDCIEDIDFDAYITSDGKVVTTKDQTYVKYLNRDDVKMIIKYVKEHNLACVFTETNDRYINQVNEVVEEYHKYIAFDVPRIENLDYALDREIVNATIFESDEVIDDLMKNLKHSKYTRWNRYGADINDINGGKDNGVRELVDYYQVEPKNILCFGDGNNDVSMFKYCGHSCAMGNARQSLKDVAEFVSSNVRRSGLVNGLKHFGIIKEDRKC